jgi:Transposase DDE domain
MALGSAVVQQRFESPRELLGDRLREESLYRLLAEHGDRLFPDDYFADLYKESSRGRPTVPARVLATVIVLQAFEGPARNREVRFTKDRFHVNLDDDTVTCPAGQTVTITWSRRGGGHASFRPHCRTCPLRSRCTAARRGRSITIHRHEAVLQHARSEQHTPEWIERYRADRPIVERKLAHFTRRLWGGRKARCRGLTRIATDVDTRAAALNLARLAILGVCFDETASVVAATS